MALVDEVYGLKYNDAEIQMQLLVIGIKQQGATGFKDEAELKQWAHDHLLDKIVFSNMSHQFLCISHKGEIMLPKVYEHYYGNILYWNEQQGNKVVTKRWHPEGFEYYGNAYIAGEQSDGTHKPLYYRDYTVPTGYYSQEKDCFNVAKPFPVFAKETGRDTSHIYTYIQHVAGECAMWLLAWLRAKMLYPTVKTQVVPIIVSRAQGSGKTTFAEVICKGLFGKDNVLVTDQYDSQARFNADYADALIVCQEEKEEVDKRNPAGALKSRATATTIRKEQKGIDPIYQESYTDFIMTTNKDVPIKFDGREDQRRFMIMEADEHFTRKESKLADEVFTKLYGYDAEYNKKGVPFQEDKDLIAQFKHELFTRQDIAEVPLRNFPKTAAYNRCFSLPRTSEAVEIESILRALAPFIKASLENKKIVEEVDNTMLADLLQFPGAMQYMPEYNNFEATVVLCRPLVFYETGTMKPYPHSTVERSLYDCNPWLMQQFNLRVLPNMEPLVGGFINVSGRYKMAPAARFAIASDYDASRYKEDIYVDMRTDIAPVERIGERMRVDKKFNINETGCFETVNEMKPGTKTLKNKSENVQYMDTFLLESDTPTYAQQQAEIQRAQNYANTYGEGADIQAKELYKERLEAALNISKQLFEEGKVARIVYSGAKSYHLLVRVKQAPTTIEEYKWLHAYLCTNLTDRLIFDESTADPARLTRSPLKMERVTSAYNLLVQGTQELICEDWSHVYDINWRPLYEQWLSRPLASYEKKFGKPLYPTRPEYQEAVEALIDGTFWSNDKYDGNRQRLFFPGYRLLRAIGYSHDDVWSGLIADGLKNYRKQQDIGYWKTREHCALIKQIDEELDEYNDKWEVNKCE